jgi:hypothetical protein
MYHVVQYINEQERMVTPFSLPISFQKVATCFNLEVFSSGLEVLKYKLGQQQVWDYTFNI